MDRDDRPMGGLIIMVKNIIKFDIIPNLNTKLIEALGINIYTNSLTPITLINAYLPGGSKHKDIINYFDSDIKLITNFNNPFFVFGDLNSKHKQWTHTINKAGSILYDLQFTSGFFVVHSDENTYRPISKNVKPSKIDLILTNNTLEYDLPTVIYDFNSDHIPVEFIFYSQLVSMLNKSPKNYTKANWNKFRNIIADKLVLPKYKPAEASVDDIDKMINDFEVVVNEAGDKSIPNSKINCKEFELPDNIRQIIRLRNYFRRNWSRHHYLPFKQEIINLNKIIKDEINNYRQNIWKTRLENIKPNNSNIFKLTKLFKNRKTGVKKIIHNSKPVISKEHTCQLFADHFFETHNNSLKNYLPEFTKSINLQCSSFLSSQITVSEIERIDESELNNKIKRLQNNKSPGFDELTNRIVKNIPFTAIKYLTFIYNSCLLHSYFPKAWKHAKVVAIPKPGKDQSNVRNYRPISLLCSASKLFESLICDRINNFVYENNIIPSQQFGFRKQHSAEHQLFRIHKDINLSLKSKKSTGLISFDIEKAFDSVWHQGLISKIIKYDFPLYITKIISSFISNRSFTV